MAEQAFDFERVIARKGTESFKWDYTEAMLGAEDVLPLWVADMDFESPPAVIEALQKRVSHGVFGYTAHGHALRQSLITWLKERQNWDVSSDWVSFMPGVVAALRLAVDTFTDPGDKIIVQPPVYYPFFQVIEDNDRQIMENPLLLRNGRYEMDFASLEECLQAGARMFVLCSPHNPVGRVWNRSELGRLSELCLEYDTIVVSDEIWSHLIFDGMHIPLASIGPETAANTITCVAPSKTFNLAGLTTSSVIIPDPAKQRRYEKAIQEHDLGLGNVLGMTAMQSAYEQGSPWLDSLLGYLAGNITYVKDYLAHNHPEVGWIHPEATYLLWLDLRNSAADEELLRQAFYRDAKLGVHMGSKFGVGGAGFVRLNIASPRSILEDAMRRWSQAMDVLYGARR